MAEKSINVNNKKNLTLSIALHCLIWITYALLPILFTQDFDFNFNNRMYYRHLIGFPLFIIFFYLNYWYLVPKFLAQKKLTWYFSTALASIMLIAVLNHHICRAVLGDFKRPQEQRREMYQPRKGKIHPYGAGFFSALFIFAISTSIRLSADRINNEKKSKELENEKLNSELSFLKSQVNPHFLFNTLNNIYGLSLTQSEKTPEAIIKLSKLLRYMLYETSSHSVLLERELEYVNDYIDLQKMRLTKEVNIDWHIEGNYANVVIEPMILIPFVENAFKHGIDYSAKSAISVSSQVIREGTEAKFFFQVKNTVHQKPSEFKDNMSGIGLSNVRKRLDLLYPEKYELKIEQEPKEYKVTLNLLLSV